MNHFQLERLAEYHRQELIEDMQQIRLEKLAREANQPRANLLRLGLMHLADWLIAAGRQLHQEFDPPQTELKLKRPA